MADVVRLVCVARALARIRMRGKVQGARTIVIYADVAVHLVLLVPVQV